MEHGEYAPTKINFKKSPEFYIAWICNITFHQIHIFTTTFFFETEFVKVIRSTVSYEWLLFYLQNLYMDMIEF